MADAPSVVAPRPSSLRPFALIWSGQALSWFGSELVQFALVWWLTAATGSATVLTLSTLLAVLPRVVLGPFAGALVDRWDRRGVLVATDAVAALATIALAAVFAAGEVQPWQIIAVLVIRAIVGVFYLPAITASTSLLVSEEYLARVGGLNQTLGAVVAMVAPAMGAALLGALPMPAVLAIDVATAVPAIGALLVVPIPRPARDAPRPTAKRMTVVRAVLTDLGEGLRVAWDRPGLRHMIGLGMLLSVLAWPLTALVPILITRHFGGGVVELGWFQAVLGLGGLLGGLALVAWGGGGRRVVAYLGVLLLHGLGIAAVGLTPADAFLIAVAAGFVCGLTAALVNGLSMAILQTIVPAAAQGRVFSLTWSALSATALLGLALAGPVADALGASIWFAIAGVGVAALSVVARFSPALMGIEAGPDGGPARASASGGSA